MGAWLLALAKSIYYYNDVIINFHSVSVPWKGEREQRLRIYKITSPEGKRKKCKKKQSETGRKDYLKNKKTGTRD